MKLSKQFIDGVEKTLRQSYIEKGTDIHTFYTKHKVFVLHEGKANDISKRMRWDILRLAGSELSYQICREAYHEGVNDDHIDTMLKRIVKNLGLE